MSDLLCVANHSYRSTPGGISVSFWIIASSNESETQFSEAVALLALVDDECEALTIPVFLTELVG